MRREPDLENGWPTARRLRRGGRSNAVSVVKLDDTLSLFGFTRFTVPRELASDAKHRTFHALATSERLQDHCIRSGRTLSRTVLPRVLASARIGAAAAHPPSLAG